MCAGGGIDELSRDAHSVCRLANAAFQHVAHPKLAPDLLHVDGAPLVGEARVAGDDEQRLEMRQRRDDVIHHSVGKIVLLRITAHVGEWQNGDGGFVGEREGVITAGRFGTAGTARPYGTRQTRIGSAIFFKDCEPISSNVISTLPRICR